MLVKCNKIWFAESQVRFSVNWKNLEKSNLICFWVWKRVIVDSCGCLYACEMQLNSAESLVVSVWSKTKLEKSNLPILFLSLKSSGSYEVWFVSFSLNPKRFVICYLRIVTLLGYSFVVILYLAVCGTSFQGCVH